MGHLGDFQHLICGGYPSPHFSSSPVLATQENLHDVTAALTTVAENFDAETFDWTSVRPCGLLYHCMRPVVGRSFTCGKILAHARSQITAFREKKGWESLFSKLALPRTLPKDFSPILTKGSIPCGWFRNPIALIQFKCWKLHAFPILVLMLAAETNMSLGVRGLWTKATLLSLHSFYMSLVAGLINQEGLAEKPPCC